MTLTPIQEAMCAVIREGGGFYAGCYDSLLRCATESVVMDYCVTGLIVCVDGHELTEQEYNQWVEQQNSRN